MKIELLENDEGIEWVVKTDDNGKQTHYNLSQNEALFMGLLIGLQDCIDELAKKIKGKE